MNLKDPTQKDVVFEVLRFLYTIGCPSAAHELEMFTKVYCDLNYMDQLVYRGEWQNLHRFLDSFLSSSGEEKSNNVNFLISKYRILEALASGNQKQAADILEEETFDVHLNKKTRYAKRLREILNNKEINNSWKGLKREREELSKDLKKTMKDLLGNKVEFPFPKGESPKLDSEEEGNEEDEEESEEGEESDEEDENEELEISPTKKRKTEKKQEFSKQEKNRYRRDVCLPILAEIAPDSKSRKIIKQFWDNKKLREAWLVYETDERLGHRHFSNWIMWNLSLARHKNINNIWEYWYSPDTDNSRNEETKKTWEIKSPTSNNSNNNNNNNNNNDKDIIKEKKIKKKKEKKDSKRRSYKETVVFLRENFSESMDALTANEYWQLDNIKEQFGGDDSESKAEFKNWIRKTSRADHFYDDNGDKRYFFPGKTEDD